MAFIDFTGERFGRLIVVSLSPYKSNYTRYWHCQCDCGNSKDIHESSLKKGTSNSCGCLQKELMRAKKTTHGKFGQRVFVCYWSMRNRCEKPYMNDYHMYGGRGIIVCERWKIFENFLTDMGEPPSKIHTLDRLDSNKNYFKENCRWATPKEQAQNRNPRGTHERS